MTDFEKPGSGWIPVQQAAQRLQSYDVAVKRMITKGDLLGTNENGRWLVSEASIEAYIERETGQRDPWVSRLLVSQMSPADIYKYSRESGVVINDATLDSARAVDLSGRALQREALPMIGGGQAVLPWSMRAIDSKTSTTGGPFKLTEPGSFIDLMRVKSSVMRAGATTLTGLRGPVAFPKETAASTGTWRAENPGSDLSPVDFATNQNVQLAFKTIATAMNVSRQALFSAASGNFDLELIIRNDLAKVVALAIDLAGLNGSGTSNQPLGLLQDTAVASTTWASNGTAPTGLLLSQVVQDVADNNADTESPSAGWLTNFAVERYARNAVRATNVNQPLLTDDGLLAGKRAVFSNQAPRNLTKGTSTTVCSAMVFGVFEHLLIGMFGAGIDVVVDPFGLKNQGMVGIALTAYCDIANRQPGAFKKSLEALTP
jgi:HK97 family phage major capsid protein